MIVRRERIAGLLIPVKSDTDFTSDVNLKENIVAVVWGTPSPVVAAEPASTARYERPSISRRDPVAGLLDVVRSDVDASDVNLKENIVPVVW